MQFSLRLIPSLAFLLAVVALCSCSASPTTEGEAYDMSSSDSNADEVGSIPEDMLADESAAESSGDAGMATASGADPFADLQEGDGGNAQMGTGETATYTVVVGDTLMKIAFSIYGDIERWKDLYEMNRNTLKSANHVKPGMQLKYEQPLEMFHPEQLSHSYTIKKGDTLAGIADEVYGRKMKYKKLQNYNAKLIKNPNRIFAGFTLFYDITQQEMAEAEARRQERMSASVGGADMMNPSMVDSSGDKYIPVPSSLVPPAMEPTQPNAVAIAPSAPAAAEPNAEVSPDGGSVVVGPSPLPAPAK